MAEERTSEVAPQIKAKQERKSHRSSKENSGKISDFKRRKEKIRGSSLFLRSTRLRPTLVRLGGRWNTHLPTLKEDSACRIHQPGFMSCRRYLEEAHPCYVPSRSYVPNGRSRRSCSRHIDTRFLGTILGAKTLCIPGPRKIRQFEVDLRPLESVIRDPEPRDRLRMRFVGADDKEKQKPTDLEHYSIRDGKLTVCANWINDRFDSFASSVPASRPR